MLGVGLDLAIGDDRLLQAMFLQPNGLNLCLRFGQSIYALPGDRRKGRLTDLAPQSGSNRSWPGFSWGGCGRLLGPGQQRVQGDAGFPQGLFQVLSLQTLVEQGIGHIHISSASRYCRPDTRGSPFLPSAPESAAFCRALNVPGKASNSGSEADLSVSEPGPVGA